MIEEKVGGGIPPVASLVVVGAPVTDEDERRPLQKPWLQVFVAHWLSEVHTDWKLPHVRIVKAVTP